jgi:hypothetical protein
MDTQGVDVTDHRYVAAQLYERPDGRVAVSMRCESCADRRTVEVARGRVEAALKVQSLLHRQYVAASSAGIGRQDNVGSAQAETESASQGTIKSDKKPWWRREWRIVAALSVIVIGGGALAFGHWVADEERLRGIPGWVSRTPIWVPSTRRMTGGPPVGGHPNATPGHPRQGPK